MVLLVCITEFPVFLTVKFPSNHVSGCDQLDPALSQVVKLTLSVDYALKERSAQKLYLSSIKFLPSAGGLEKVL